MAVHHNFIIFNIKCNIVCATIKIIQSLLVRKAASVASDLGWPDPN